MKKIPIVSFVFLLASYWSLAQPPAQIHYQAVIRDGDGTPLTERKIRMQLSILKGSMDGLVAYAERQSPVTNRFGLVSIVIGGDSATVVAGDIARINWSDGPYFLKTEIDAEGGMSYTTIGTSQLISVPYALHAGTADSLAGDLDLSGLASQAALEDTASQIRESIPEAVLYHPGDHTQGGIVFWTDPTHRHGLVCAPEDLSSDMRWFAGTYGPTYAMGNGVYAGKMNTMIIIAAHAALGDDGATYAARLCNELTVQQEGVKYGDWYLPSFHELQLMFDSREVLNAALSASGGSELGAQWYWSSTEVSSATAAVLYFLDGTYDDFMKDNIPSVRAIRSF